MVYLVVENLDHCQHYDGMLLPMHLSIVAVGVGDGRSDPSDHHHDQ